MLSARVIQVIETNIQLRGKGTSEDVFRRVVQYWTLDGELLAEVDPFPNGSSAVSKGTDTP